MASGDASVPCSRRIGWRGSLLKGGDLRPLRARFQVSMLGAWPIIVCLFLDEMGKKGSLLTCSKVGKTWCFRFLRRFFGKKVASGRKGKEVSWHSIIELHRTSNLGENALKGA